jgi:eukaryotic-like serine/threonine-protein kinase
MSVERLDDLLLRWEELCEAGQTVSAEELCTDCPELLDELRRRIQALRRMNPALATDLPASTSPGSGGKPGPTRAPAIPGYEILGELGRGGMGVVYKARQTSLDRLVALKMILAGEHASDDQRARFRGEAEAAAQLQHPNIVQVHEVGELVGCPYFSLEHVDGLALSEVILEFDCPPPLQAAALVEHLARAVAYAHEHGIVHRDLKPSNILLQKQSASSTIHTKAASDTSDFWYHCLPKIADFGLAKRLGTRSRTRTGAVMGTPSYMAPEQASGAKDIGPGVDIHALGAILYELLTGRPPFEAASDWDTVTLVISAEPTPPSHRNPRVPRDLETICLKCLRKEPGKRYASASALADDLRHFQCGEPIAARPVGRLERGVKWVRRRPAVAVMAAVSAAFALAAGSAVLQLIYRHPPATAQDPLVESRRAEVIREVDSLRQRPPALITGQPPHLEEVEKLPPVDYAAFEILNDERIVDLRQWKPVAPERAAERVSASSMMRRVRLRKLRPADEIRFEYRSTGIAMDLQCTSHLSHYRVAAQKTPGFVGGKRTQVRQIIVDVGRFPVHSEFTIHTLAIYWNGLQEAGDLWFGAIGYQHSFKVSLLVIFPGEKPFRDFQMLVAPTKEEKATAFAGRKILLVSEGRDWLYWEIPEPEAGRVYSLHWTW